MRSDSTFPFLDQISNARQKTMIQNKRKQMKTIRQQTKATATLDMLLPYEGLQK
jgi:hypothetical protein